MPVDLSDSSDTQQQANNNNNNNKFFYKSIIYCNQDKPKWHEVVSVSIPHGKTIDEIKRTFLRFLIRNRSIDGRDKTKVLGVCYLQITNEDGSAIAETQHCALPMIKLDGGDDSSSSTAAGGGDYYYPLRNLPPALRTTVVKSMSSSSSSSSGPAAGGGGGGGASEKMRDYLDVRVKVVSTQLTQNVTLLNLLSFATDVRPDCDRYASLLTYLDELGSLSDEQSAEIVKFLQATLDKLIDILLDLNNVNNNNNNNNSVKTPLLNGSNNNNGGGGGGGATPAGTLSERTLKMHTQRIQPRVFEILVSIFQIIENQSKFASFRTVIDAYLAKNFCITLAHRPLLRIFHELMSSVCERYAMHHVFASADCASIGEGGGGASDVVAAAAITTTPTLTTGAGASFGSPSSPPSRVSSTSLASCGVGAAAAAAAASANVANEDTRSMSASVGTGNGTGTELIINTIKSMEYIFKFAFRSRELFAVYCR